MDNQFETLVQSPSKPINHRKVVRQIKLEYKDFQSDQGIYCIYLENQKLVSGSTLVVKRVPADTDKQTQDKKNYYCLDITQEQPKKRYQKEPEIMRGFVVQNPRQTVFFSATNNQGFLMISRSKDKKTSYLRPFLCGTIFKKKPEDMTQANLMEAKAADDGVSKILKSKSKMGVEMFLSLGGKSTQVKDKKEESEFYIDTDKIIAKKEIREIKQHKIKARENQEEGIDSEEERDFLRQQREENDLA